MGRSIRSKRGRKLRSIKRERYAVKEMKRLKDMLGIKENMTEDDVKMCVSDIATVVDGDSITVKTEKEDEDGIMKQLKEIKAEPKLNLYAVKGVEILVGSDTSDDEEEKSVEVQRNIVPSSSPIVLGETSKEIEMDHSQKRVFDPITKKDQFGTYPIWFTKRDKRRQKAKMEARRKKLKRLQQDKMRIEMYMGMEIKAKRGKKLKKLRKSKKSKANKGVE